MCTLVMIGVNPYAVHFEFSRAPTLVLVIALVLVLVLVVVLVVLVLVLSDPRFCLLLASLGPGFDTFSYLSMALPSWTLLLGP